MDLTLDALPDAIKQGILFATLEPPGVTAVTEEGVECPRCHAAHVLFAVHKGSEPGTLAYHCLPCGGRSTGGGSPCPGCWAADSRRVVLFRSWGA